jgi:SARP family transcriptional regulator, regulator of embCAB operon
VVEHGGRRVEALLPGRQGRLALAYLVLNRNRVTSRDELIEALWPSMAHGPTAVGLNALISKIRRLFAIEGRTGLRLILEPDALVDVEAAVSAVHRAESRIALGDWANAWGPALVALIIAERDFLAGDGALPGAAWFDTQRDLLQDIRLRALEAYGNATLEIGGTELPAAVRASRQLVRLAPLRESGHQLLMRSLAAQGNVAEALVVYADVRGILREELGISPCAGTQAIYDRLLHA